MNCENVETWHGIIISPAQHVRKSREGHKKTGRTSCTNWTNSFGVSGFRTSTHLLHGHFYFLNLFELQTFFAFLGTIKRDVINFQHFLTSFAIFQSFPEFKKWTHFMHKLFRSIRVSDDNSSVTWALQCFLNLFELRTSFVFSMQHSKRRHQFPTCSDIICCFSVIYLIVQRAK